MTTTTTTTKIEEKVGPCYLCLLDLRCDFSSPWHEADSKAAVELIEAKAFGLVSVLTAQLMAQEFEAAKETHRGLKSLKTAVEFLEGGAR
jgi:hypothetical protein